MGNATLHERNTVHFLRGYCSQVEVLCSEVIHFSLFFTRVLYFCSIILHFKTSETIPFKGQAQVESVPGENKYVCYLSVNYLRFFN